jgi:Sec-independent protein translocase protein TatA
MAAMFSMRLVCALLHAISTAMLLGSLGGWEIVLILAIVLVLFGAKTFPDILNGFRQGIEESKKASREITEEIHEPIDPNNPPPERTSNDEMNVYLKPLGQSLAHLQQASMWFMQNAMTKPDNAGAGASDYMHLFGLVALGYMWCRIAEAALAKMPKANGQAARYSAKLVTARFFMERMLPETATRLARIQAGAASTMEMPDEQF